MKFLNIIDVNRKTVRDNIILLFIYLSISYCIGWSLDHTYKSYVTVAPAEETSSILNSSFQGIGGGVLSGFLGGETTKVQIALATLNSKTFLNGFVNKYSLHEQIGNPETYWGVHKEMSKRLVVEKSSGSSIMSISLILDSAEESASKANSIVRELNQFLMSKELTRLERSVKISKEEIKITKNINELEMLYILLERNLDRKVLLLSQSEYVFKIIDPAEPPASKYWPNYFLLTLIGFIVFLFLSLAYYLATSDKIKELLFQR